MNNLKIKLMNIFLCPISFFKVEITKLFYHAWYLMFSYEVLWHLKSKNNGYHKNYKLTLSNMYEKYEQIWIHL